MKKLAVFLLAGILLLGNGVWPEAVYAAEGEVEINADNFPDIGFLNYVSWFDMDYSGSLSQEEIDAVSEIDLNEYGFKSLNLQGIEYFKNLSYLDCSDCGVQKLDVNSLKKLKYLYCGGNQLSSLNVSGLSELIELHCDNNDLTSLDVSGHTEMRYLFCYNNKNLKELNIISCDHLLKAYEEGGQPDEWGMSYKILNPYYDPDYDPEQDRELCWLCVDPSTKIKTHDHSPVVIPGTAASCTATGLTDGSKCSICGEILQEQTEIPATGHKWGEWKVTKPATADAEGEEQRVCENDSSHVEKRAIDKLPKPDEPTPKPDEPSPKPDKPVPEKDIYGNPIEPVDTKEAEILAQSNEKDLKGSTFSLLQAKAKKVTKNSVKLTWKRVSGASDYTIYGNRCGKGKKYQKIATVSGTSFTQKKLKKGTYYKYIVVAVGNEKALAVSKTIHAATTGGKVGNAKAVKVRKAKVAVKAKKKARIKASVIPKSSKLKIKKHRPIAFESANPKIATVNKKGVIKGVSKGKCTVYAYAQNGQMKAIKVTVK